MDPNSGDVDLFKVSSPLPVIPEEAEKDEIKSLLKNYAIQNGFILTTLKSESSVFHLKCEKGGTYRNWRHMSEENRKRFKKSTKTGCPYVIRVGKTKSQGFRYLKPVSDNEDCHNHSLNEKNLLTTTIGRKINLTSKDLEKVNEGVERNIPTKIIQKSISNDSEMNKLTVHDINNMKYKFKNKLDLKSDDGATVLIKYIESKQFITKYRCDSTTNALDALFITNKTLIARAKQFPELVIIDATYSTNNLRMPLICAYGVSNLGGMALKTFPIAFCWATCEKEYIYCWFLRTLKNFMNESLSGTIFVTDKCTALMNQLDKQFNSNKKLLCTWHMINNLSSNCTKAIFRERATIQKFKDTVYTVTPKNVSYDFQKLKLLVSLT